MTTRFCPRLSLLAAGLLMGSAAFSQTPTGGTVAFVLPANVVQKDVVAALRLLARGPEGPFDKAVQGRGLRSRRLAPSLRVVWGPRVTLEATEDTLGDLAKAMDDDRTVRFDQLPPSVRQGVLAMVARAPSVAGATFGTPAPSLRVSISTQRDVFFTGGGRTLDMEVPDRPNRDGDRRALDSRRYGDPPSETEAARWKRLPDNDAAPSSFVMDLGTTRPETYAIVAEEVGRFISEETARNMEARRKAQVSFLRVLLGEEGTRGLGTTGTNARAAGLAPDLRQRIEGGLSQSYASKGFGSEEEALRWLSGATVSSQYVRIVVNVPSGSASAPLFMGFEAVPSILLP